MIGLEDIYKVIVATVPLYFALMLGYGSVKWWRVFTPDQCNAINRFVAYFTLPLFTFEFAANIDPFHMNYRFIAADVISKAIIVSVLAFWAKFLGNKTSYCWSITSFSLSTLTNSLVVGVPLVQAMYGQSAVDLVVQGSVVQAILWLTLLLFVLELRRTHIDFYSSGDHNNNHQSFSSSSSAVHDVVDDVDNRSADHNNNNNDLHNIVNNNNNDVVVIKDLEGNQDMIMTTTTKPSFLSLMKVVGLKLAMNPNSYACVIGITWAFISNRWHFQMPEIMEGSIMILSKAGTGTAMFSMGLFMALQKKIIACGTSLTIYGMVLRFIAGPAAMAIGSIAMGLHGDVLRVAIIQAAIPQSITSFIFAKEYSLHADVLSTAVIFGMMVSLPLLVGYYAILEFLH